MNNDSNLDKGGVNGISSKKGCLFTFYTLTPLHAGAGESASAIDLPIQREKHTEYPVVYSSGIKGSLRCFFERNLVRKEDVDLIFGKEGDESGSGKVIFTDAKIFLFPVRSSEGVFKWITCPFIIERIKNDLKFIGIKKDGITKITVSDYEGISSKNNGKTIVLEDFPITINSFAQNDAVYNLIKNLTSEHFDEETLKDRLIIVSDGVFKTLVTNATQIIPRNVLDDNKISKNLWYEETVPPDSLFYMVTIPVPGNDNAISNFKKVIENKVLQIGGNETIGYGFVRMSSDISIMLMGGEK